MANLSWTASTETSWISISPTTGTGSQNVTITTGKAAYGETDLTGSVTFSGSDGSVRTVQVTRCKETECEVESVVYDFYPQLYTTAEACQTQVNAEIGYRKITTYSTPGCPYDEESGTSAITTTIEKNETNEYKSYQRRIGNTNSVWIINQKPGPCDCDCGGIVPSDKIFFGWEWDEYGDEAKKQVALNIADCFTITNVTLSPMPSHFSLSKGNTLTIWPSGKNETDKNIPGSVIISYKSGGKDCSETIHLTQYYNNEQHQCPTYTINPTSGNINGDCSGGTVTFTATVQ